MINLTQQKKLQRTQNQCIWLIDKGQQVSEIRQKHHILSINKLTTLENYKIWHKEQRNSLPQNLLKLMREDHLRQPIKKKHKYATRNKQQMNLPTARSRSYQNSFLFKGLREFQLLPNYFKTENDEQSFIKKCKEELLK